MPFKPKKIGSFYYSSLVYGPITYTFFLMVAYSVAQVFHSVCFFGLGGD